MVTHQSTEELNQTAQQALTSRLLQPLIKKRRPQRVLLLRHELASDISIACCESTELISLSNDPYALDAQVVARICALPFEDQAFDLIVLQHLISDGSEEVLAEAARVLAPAGDIIISGLNSAGLRYHSKPQNNPYPAIRINKVYHLLKSQSFSINNCLRAGFAGLAWPQSNSGWLSSSLPFADRVAIHAHHHSGPQALRLSGLEKIRSATVSTACLDLVGNRRSQK